MHTHEKYIVLTTIGDFVHRNTFGVSHKPQDWENDKSRVKARETVNEWYKESISGIEEK